MRLASNRIATLCLASLALVLACAPEQIRADALTTLNFEVTFIPDEFSTDEVFGENGERFYTVVNARDLVPGPSDAGLPIIPAKQVYVLLPPGCAYAGAAITRCAEIPWRENATLAPWMPTNTTATPGTVLNKAVYGSSDWYPASPLRYVQTVLVRGRALAQFFVYPIRFLPLGRRLSVMTELEVALVCTAAPPVALPMTPTFANMINVAVINPDPLLRVNAITPAIAYLIITSNQLVTAFQELATYRAAQFGAGRTAVVSVEQIAQQFPALPQLEQIRNYILQQVQSNGVEYVLIGGDPLSVPVQHVAFGDPTDVDNQHATDSYFSAPEDEWPIDPEHMPALALDVIIGRLPVRTPEQVAAYLGKLQAYENGGQERTAGKYYVTGARAFRSYSSEPTDGRGPDLVNDGCLQFREHNPVSDSEEWARRMYQDVGLCYYPATQVGCLFDTVNSWGTNYAFSVAHLMDRWNEGWEFMINNSHGDYDLFGYSHSPDIKLDTNDAARLTNVICLVAAVSCMSGGFDHEVDPCFSEALLRNPNGGALLYFGCTRYGLANDVDEHGGMSAINIMMLHRRLLQGGLPASTYGAAYALEKLDSLICTMNGTSEAFLRLHYGINLQGDPALMAPSARPVTAGSVARVAATDVTGMGTCFGSTPKVKARPDALGAKAVPFQVLNKIKSCVDTAGTAYTARCLLTGSIKRDRLAPQASSVALNLDVRGTTATGGKILDADGGRLRFVKPAIHTIECDTNLTAGAQMIISGTFFGNKLPQVFIEGTKAGKSVLVPCVVKSYLMYAGVNGKQLAGVMNPDTGSSLIYVSYPVMPKGVEPSAFLLLRTKSGYDRCQYALRRTP